MVLRWYAAISLALVAVYPVLSYDAQTWPFLLVTLGGLPAVLIGLRRCPADSRLPWWLLLAGLVTFNAGNFVWLWMIYAEDRPTAGQAAAYPLFNLANLLLFAAAVVVVLRRGRRDVGGVIDSAITALALGGLLWDAVLLPRLTAAGTSATGQAGIFVDVLIMAGTLGALLRVSLVAGRVPALWLFAGGMASGLLGSLAAVLSTDPVTGVQADWTTVIYLLGYALLGCAALHPSSVVVTQPGPAPRDDLSVGRLSFLGGMTALIPLVGGGRAIFGLAADGLLIAIGSTLVISLVMVRVGRLAGQRRRAEHALLRMATHDDLTGLPNRAAFLDRLTAELSGPGVAVLFCDLDGFKPVNDRLGHAAGDELLIAVAERLRGCVREQDLVSRFGGDEFMVLCRDDDPRATVDAVCGRIRELVRQPFTAGGESVRIGISVGVAFSAADSSPDDLISRADLAMYAAKESKSVGALSLVLA